MKSLISLSCGLLLAVLLGSGCNKAGSAVASNNRPGWYNPPPGAEPGAAADSREFTRGKTVYDVRDRAKMMIQLDQLGKSLMADFLVAGKLPAKVEDVKECLKDYVEVYNLLKKRSLVMVENARFASDSILVYERDTETTGHRLVLRGDGGVVLMSDDEFRAAMRATGR